MHIEWGSLTFGPVNLWSLPPAWFFYMSVNEKKELARQVKDGEFDVIRRKMGVTEAKTQGGE